MTTVDLSPKYGTEGGERVLRDRSTIRAYLEELARFGTEAGLAAPGRPAQPARVAGVGEDRFQVCAGAPLPEDWAPGAGLDLHFTIDGIRLLAPATVQARGDRDAWLALPATVGFADRRSRMRAHFGQREKATVTVLEGFLGARGATGPLLNLSLEGVRMRMERAITVHGKAPLAVGAATFQPGTKFPILRIDQLPYAPVLVCAGVLAHVSHGADGVQMGIRFENLGEMEAQAIRQILGRRLPRFNVGFPERRRRQAPPGGETPKVTVVHQGQIPAAPPEPSPGDPRKAERRILLAVPDDLDRAILETALRAGGYRKVHEARTLPEALDQIKAFPMDALILAEAVGGLDAGAFLSRLRRHGCERTPALLLAGQVDVRILALARQAQIEHVLPLGGDCGEAFLDVLAGVLG